MKIGKFEVDSSKALGIGLAGLGLLQMLLSNKAQAHERAAMKAELRKEIVEDLTKQSSN